MAMIQTQFYRVRGLEELEARKAAQKANETVRAGASLRDTAPNLDEREGRKAAQKAKAPGLAGGALRYTTPSLDAQGVRRLEGWAGRISNESARRLMGPMIRQIFENDEQTLDVRVARNKEAAAKYSDPSNREAALKGKEDLGKLAAAHYVPHDDSVDEMRYKMAELAVFALRVCENFRNLYMPGNLADEALANAKVVDDIVNRAYEDAHWVGEPVSQTYREVNALLVEGRPTVVHAPQPVAAHLSRVLHFFVSEGGIAWEPMPANVAAALMKGIKPGPGQSRSMKKEVDASVARGLMASQMLNPILSSSSSKRAQMDGNMESGHLETPPIAKARSRGGNRKKSVG